MIIKKYWPYLAAIAILLVSFGFYINKAQAAFNPNYLISDGTFISVDAMDTPSIQRFLISQNSYLKDFSEGGRSAAQIIYDASHGYADASGSINGITINTSTGTVNPRVILTTLQKEQSLISKTSRDDSALRKAMGYACPDSGGCNSAYAGFTKQVENASWQLRYNYERSQGHGFGDFQVGKTFSFDDWNGNHSGTFENRATASLYRYTPHVYNGNYNFWNLFFNVYKFDTDEYVAQYQGQTRPGKLRIGDTATIEVRFKNTGSATWYNSGSHPVTLALDKYWATSTAWQGSGWLNQNRLAKALEGTVAPGQTATFRFQIRCPAGMVPGVHRFKVRLVAENLTWFDHPDTNGGAWWDFNVPSPSATHVNQSGSITALPGETANLHVTFKNVTGVSWRNYTSPVNLAVDPFANESFSASFRDSSWVSKYRIAGLPSSLVANGQNATFNFKIKVPSNLTPGEYRFHARLVQDGFTWFKPDVNGGAWWQVTIPQPTAVHAGQSRLPALQKGQTYGLYVKFRNTTSTTWHTSGDTPVVLALDKFWADSSAWKASDWISQNRITKAEEGDIAPGQTGTFRFNITVPNSMPSGHHGFFVRLVSENYAWFENPDTNGGAWWDFVVR